MIRLELAGAHTQLLSTLCAECPQGSTGCCKAPPDVDWADIARIVHLGGRDWLLAEIAAGNLIAFDRGLKLRRVRTRTAPLERRSPRCVYHGPTGCTISQANRPATCNYFLCEDTFIEGGEAKAEPSALAARRAWNVLRNLYSRHDDHFAGFVRSGWPDGPIWNADFLDALGQQFAAIEELGAQIPDLAANVEKT